MIEAVINIILVINLNVSFFRTIYDIIMEIPPMKYSGINNFIIILFII